MEKPNVKDLTRVYEQEKLDLVVRLQEYTKSCGHPGYLIEVYVKTNGKLVQTGCFGWEDTLSTVRLLLDAREMADDLFERWLEHHVE